jgi:hypothetical protein
VSGPGYGPYVTRSQLEVWAREEAKRRQAEQDELDRVKEQNERLHQEWKARLKAEEDRKRAESDARLELEPIKTREHRAWLVAHLTLTEADFEKRVWPLIKQNLVEDRQQILC